MEFSFCFIYKRFAFNSAVLLKHCLEPYINRKHLKLFNEFIGLSDIIKSILMRFVH